MALVEELVSSLSWFSVLSALVSNQTEPIFEGGTGVLFSKRDAWRNLQYQISS
jgi:hypothetical protein